MSDEKYYILSVDGGGIRGVFPAYILAQVENKLKIDLYEKFDFFTGTSTGSIIAAAAACRIKMDDVQELYKKDGEKIFKKNFLYRFNGLKHLWGIRNSLYKSDPLKTILKNKLKARKMKDIPKDKALMIPASNINTGDVYVIKSAYDDKFVRDPETLISDAVLASCAAPTFFDPVKIGNALLADGGLWINNPSFAAVIEAMRRGVKKENIKVLSIGTGEETKIYKNWTKACSGGWGILRWFPPTKLLPLILSLQSKTAHNFLTLFLEKDQLLRINFKINDKIDLDDAGAIEQLLGEAEQEFTHQSDAIKQFLEG